MSKLVQKQTVVDLKMYSRRNQFKIVYLFLMNTMFKQKNLEKYEGTECRNCQKRTDKLCFCEICKWNGEEVLMYTIRYDLL